MKVLAPRGYTVKTAWDAFVRFVARLVGIKTPALQSALDKAMVIGAELMRENSNLTGRCPWWADRRGSRPYNHHANQQRCETEREGWGYAVCDLRTTARLTCSRQSLDSRMAGSGWTRWAQGGCASVRLGCLFRQQ